MLSEIKPEVKELHDNEILVQVEGKDIPVTLDSGATITVLPKEMIPNTWLTGRQIAGKGFGIDHEVNIEEAHLSLQVAGKHLTTMGGVVPAKQINGIRVLSYKSTNGKEDISFPKLLQDALTRTDEDRLYLDYSNTNQDTQGVVMDSLDGGDEVVHVEAEQEEVIDSECLGIRKEGFLVEEEGSLEEDFERSDLQSGEEREIIQKEQSVTIDDATNNHGMDSNDIPVRETPDSDCISAQTESAMSGEKRSGDKDATTLDITIPRYTEDNSKLRENTMSDSTLKNMRELADKKLQGYYWQGGLIIRERLDDLGRVKRQMVSTGVANWYQLNEVGIHMATSISPAPFATTLANSILS